MDNDVGQMGITLGKELFHSSVVGYIAEIDHRLLNVSDRARGFC